MSIIIIISLKISPKKWLSLSANTNVTLISGLRKIVRAISIMIALEIPMMIVVEISITIAVEIPATIVTRTLTTIVARFQFKSNTTSMYWKKRKSVWIRFRRRKHWRNKYINWDNISIIYLNQLQHLVNRKTILRGKSMKLFNRTVH